MTKKVTRKRVKNLSIRITREGEVLVTAPIGMSDEYINAFLQKKRGWIEKHRAEMLEKSKLRPHEYVSGETLRVLGEPYTLHFLEGKMPKAELRGGELVLTVRPGSTPEQREAVLIEFYRAILTPIAEEYLELWQ